MYRASYAGLAQRCAPRAAVGRGDPGLRYHRAQQETEGGVVEPADEQQQGADVRVGGEAADHCQVVEVPAVKTAGNLKQAR